MSHVFRNCFSAAEINAYTVLWNFFVLFIYFHIKKLSKTFAAYCGALIALANLCNLDSSSFTGIFIPKKLITSKVSSKIHKNSSKKYVKYFKSYSCSL